MFVPSERVAAKPDLTETAVGNLKEALGVPADVRVDELVKHRARRSAILALVFALVAVAAIAYWFQIVDERNRAAQDLTRDELNRNVERLQQLVAENERLQENLDLVQNSVQDKETELAQVRSQMDKERIRLEQDRRELQVRLAKLEQDENASSSTIARIQEELEDARKNLELLDPVNLQKSRLVDVARVGRSIVLLEAQMMFRNKVSEKVLHIATHEGDEIPNFDDLGEPWAIDSTGSGFCVSEEGWIITNAHVVTPGGSEADMLGDEIEAFMKINAVFSNSSVRHPARVIKVADEFGQDLALVKIEPFEGMSYLEDFDLSAPIPDPGTDVYLFGFPLGNFALQQGSTVIASTFRGILSRLVDNRLQVDAGVHPGNSGGPITDSRGRVIGVVFSVQATPEQSAVYTIGYGIPIADAGRIWPPPADWDK